MYTKFKAAKSVLIVLALCLFIMGCTDEGILGLQEETEVLNRPSSSDTDNLSTDKGMKFHFNASLKGRNEVGPVDSKAAGVAIVTINKDETMVHFKVNVANIIDVTQSHFHMAPIGVNGPAVAFIFPFQENPSGRMNGTLAEGVVTSDDFLNVDLTMEGFIWAIRNGGVYVNVHTSVNPGGEIRGQL